VIEIKTTTMPSDHEPVRQMPGGHQTRIFRKTRWKFSRLRSTRKAIEDILIVGIDFGEPS
jgi:hypothetical protein